MSAGMEPISDIQPPVVPNHRQLLWRLALVVPLMFAFAVWVLPPLYDAFCQLTGLNGRIVERVAADKARPLDLGRTVEMQFLADVDRALPWQFAAKEPVLELHPGQIVTTHFLVRNLSDKVVVGRAVPSISPELATRYIKKSECFCFREQRLQPGEVREMPLVFYVDPELPRHVGTVTLAYRFYNITDKASVMP